MVWKPLFLCLISRYMWNYMFICMFLYQMLDILMLLPRESLSVCQTFPGPPCLQKVVDALNGLVLNVREKNSTMQFTF